MKSSACSIGKSKFKNWRLVHIALGRPCPSLRDFPWGEYIPSPRTLLGLQPLGITWRKWKFILNKSFIYKKLTLLSRIIHPKVIWVIGMREAFRRKHVMKVAHVSRSPYINRQIYIYIYIYIYLSKKKGQA
jgi:hypothetical protein